MFCTDGKKCEIGCDEIRACEGKTPTVFRKEYRLREALNEAVYALTEKETMSEKIFDWVTEQMGRGERAGNFNADVKVWSEYAIRAAILRALADYEKLREEHLQDD